MQHRFWSGIVLASLVLSAAQTTAVAAKPSEGQSGGQPAWLSRAGARAEPEAIQPLPLLQHQQGFQRANEVLAQTRGQSSSPYPAEVQHWQQQAKALMEQGRYQEAVQFQEKVLAWTEQHLRHDQAYTATSLNNLAELYLNQGAYAKAEPLYIRALAICEKALGPDHPDTAQSLNNLAALYYSQGAYAKAEPLYVQALAIWEKALGPDHPDTATSLNNLAELYGSQGAYAKAEPLYLRALAIREKALGPDHPDTATSLNNLAGLDASQGAYAKAEPLYIRALAIFEKTFGSNHPNTIKVRENLVQCRKALGDRGADFADFTAGRELWFKMTASQAKISPSAEFSHVFIVMMDWRIENKQTLVAATADRTSSLYISPGSQVLGGYSAKEEAKAVITAAEKFLH